MLCAMDRPIHNETAFGPAQAGHCPLTLFAQWFEAAMEADPNNAAVMTLATALDNHPSARMVLLKAHGPDGFVFYTNYMSRKGRELEENPQASLVFWFSSQERQIRVEGQIEKISSEASDAYFASRPRDSQLGAWASAQSSEVDAPVTLDEARKKFGADPIPRPCSWGGLRLIPQRFEFWQGRASRLHDRIVFEQAGNGWVTKRLAP